MADVVQHAKRLILVTDGSGSALRDSACLWQLSMAQQADIAAVQHATQSSARGSLPRRVADAISAHSVTTVVEVCWPCGESLPQTCEALTAFSATLLARHCESTH